MHLLAYIVMRLMLINRKKKLAEIPGFARGVAIGILEKFLSISVTYGNAVELATIAGIAV